MDWGSLRSSVHDPLPKPALCSSCHQKPRESENTPDVLDDPILTFPNSQGGNQAPPTSPEPPTSLGPSDQSQTPPRYVPLYLPLPQEGETSPSRVTCSGTSCHSESGSKLAPTSAPQGLYPLQDGGMTRVHVPFSMGDLGICKEMFGRFSENPDNFRDEFIRLGLTFSLTWQDIMVILAHCYTPDEKERILRKAREHGDGLLATSLHHHIYQVGENTIPEHDPHWDYEDRLGQGRMRHYITCLSERMKRCRVKPVNYDKIREVTQEKDENLEIFLSWVTDTFRKNTNTDPESSEGRTLSAMRFITQATPDIQRKFQKLEAGPQTPLSTLVEEAFKV